MIGSIHGRTAKKSAANSAQMTSHQPYSRSGFAHDRTARLAQRFPSAANAKKTLMITADENAVPPVW